MNRRYKVLASWLSVVLVAAAVGYSTRRSWKTPDGDFASYYTAALSVRKGVPLNRLYEMPYFQQQMELAGIKNQLGGYIPQTPATMLPFLPLTSLSILNAKRAWLLESLLFLAGAVWLLSRVTSFRISYVLALAIFVIGSLYTNFLLGQIYLLLLMLLAASVLLLEHKQEWSGGFLLGVVFGLKLITAPFFLFFAVKRQWKPLAGMITAFAVGLIALISIFGWDDLAFYATHILPRSLVGETLDPYNPGNGTLTTFLRRFLIREPELNPHPAFHFPWLFFFLQPLFTISILWLSLLGFATKGSSRGAFAGFFITILALSPNTASYTFLLLLLPLALLLSDSDKVRDWTLLLSFVFLLALPLRPAWSWAFPKVWLLLGLFAFTLFRYRSAIKLRTASIGIVGAFLISLPLAGSRLRTYNQEPGQRWERVVVEPGALYSAYPASLPGSITYESIAGNHYVLKVLRNQLVKPEIQRGDALQRITNTGQPDSIEKRLSPDGKWYAFARSHRGSTQIYIVDKNGESTVQVTDGRCNSTTPAWEWNSQALLFASDCGRGVGLPALYRAPLSQIPGLHR